MDATVKREYLEALEIVPHLVQDESNRLKFLRTDDFDPVKAARRLCLYWKYRKVVFVDRWLLPCTQTGSGCLRRDAIDLIRSGFITLMSKPSEPPVLLIDATRRQGPTADHTVGSIAFYFATTIADEKFQSEGVILLHLIETNGYWNTNPAPTNYWGIIHEALPFKIKAILMVPSFAKPGRQHVLDYLSFQTSRLVEARSRRTSEIVAAKTLGETVQRLESLGISRINLPPCLGGTFNDTHLYNWIRARLSVEDAMSAASPILNQIHAQRGSSLTLIRQRQSGGTADIQSEEEKREFLRQRNALYSRRKYHKNKLDMITLSEQSKWLQDQNALLRADNNRLAALLVQAQAIVDAHLSTLKQET
eukprot:scaffold22839_cov171-Amphora_coffeaeformis.AAC.11